MASIPNPLRTRPFAVDGQYVGSLCQLTTDDLGAGDHDHGGSQQRSWRTKRQQGEFEGDAAVGTRAV